MDSAEETTCPFCEGPIWTDDEVCLHCDASLTPGTCLHCRRENPREARRCDGCGSPNLLRSLAGTPAAASRPKWVRTARWLGAGLLCAAIVAAGFLAMPSLEKPAPPVTPPVTPPEPREDTSRASVIGMCQVSEYPLRNVLPLSAPDQGRNYVRKRFPAPRGAEDVRKRCTRAVFRELLKTYVRAGNTNPALRNGILYEQDGEQIWSPATEVSTWPVPVDSPSFPAETCTGTCLIQAFEPQKAVDRPMLTAPDRGRDYARRRFPGACSPEKLRGLCTKAVYKDLIEAYVRAGGVKIVSREFAWYDEDGAMISFDFSPGLARPDGESLLPDQSR